ncbi:hypothetical protein ACWKWN_08160 [Microbacterium trichothecenolyticum]
MMLVAARAEVPHTHGSEGGVRADQRWFDEEFFRIVRRSFAARRATSSIALPAHTAIVRAAAPTLLSLPAADRGVPRARVRSPPPQKTSPQV